MSSCQILGVSCTTDNTPAQTLIQVMIPGSVSKQAHCSRRVQIQWYRLVNHLITASHVVLASTQKCKHGLTGM